MIIIINESEMIRFEFPLKFEKNGKMKSLERGCKSAKQLLTNEEIDTSNLYDI